MPLNRGVDTSLAEDRRRGALLLTHMALSAALVAVGPICWWLAVDAERLIYPACLLLTSVFVWNLWSWTSARTTLFEPYPLFMVAAGLFNGGQAFLEVLGLNTSGILDGRFAADTLVATLYLVTIALAFFHCGALIALRRTGSSAPSTPVDRPTAECAARMVGWFLLAISAVPTFILLWQSVTLVMASGYMALYQGDDPQALSRVVSAFLVPGAIFVLVGSPNRPKIHAVCFAVVGFHALVFLFLGARAAAATGCLAMAWAFDRSVRRIPRRVILAFGLVALLLFGLVQQTRGTAGGERLSFESQYAALVNLERPATAAISEMGGSMITVAYTIGLVPADRSFDWGVSYWYALLTLMPNFGGDLHPSVAHGSLSVWLIRTVDPVIAAAGGGLGYSFIAEAYLNFGWIGTPVWLTILGYLLCRIFLVADSSDLAKQAMIASFLSSIVLLPRGESAIVVRGLVWYAVVPYLMTTSIANRLRRPTTVVTEPPFREAPAAPDPSRA